MRVPVAFRLLFFIASTFFVVKKSFSQTEFIENKGQWNPQVKFMSNAGNGAFFLRNNGFTVVQHNPEDIEEVVDHHKITNENTANALARPARSKILHSHAYNVEFVNSNSSIEIIPDKAEPTVNNYFIGNDKTKWASDCRIFKGVTYKNVYPNVDVRYYSDAGQRLKYDIIAHPGADINKIALRYKGVDKLSIKNKELIISTSVGENKELYPYSYQVNNSKRSELNCSYKIEGDIVKFKVKGYSPATTLIIDPTEIFFSYTGSTADNWGFTATYGPDGSFFAGGIVFGQGFPVTEGAYQTNYENTQNNDFDIGIMKLSPDGVNRIYATYIGGDHKDQPHSLIVDPQGNLILAGRSSSSNYPLTVPVFGGGGGFDIIVTKLNAAGNALIGSMRIGGSGNDGVNMTEQEESGAVSLKRKYGDDARSEVIIDGSNNIYVSSCTTSDDFPTTSGVFQSAFGGRQDGVVIKLNSNCNAVLWSSYLGGSGDDACYVSTIGNNGNLYVAGGTGSSNLSSISAGGVISSTNSGGVSDGFVVELANTGSKAIRGTYLGTTSMDQVYGIQTDKLGFIYVMGTTEGTWHVENAVYVNANAKQFIAKIKPDLSAYVYSTTFGSTSLIPSISPTAFLVDRCENVYVSGWGGKSNSGYDNSNVRGMPVTADAIKPQTDASGSDFYFFVLRKDAASQLYGTFFGQEDPRTGSTPMTFGDHVDGGTSRFDKNGVIYQAICGNCFREVTFDGTPGVWSRTNRALSGGKCNLGMLKIEMNFAGVSAGPKSSIEGIANDTSGCIPLTVHFSDTLKKGKSYVWDFGDGSPKEKTTSLDIFHTYTSTGKFRVMLVALDSSTCNIADTGYVTIKAGSNKAFLDFISNKIPPCTNLSYTFTNTSRPTTGSFGDSSFIWDFGDNTPKITTGTTPINHTYAGPGTYKVSLTLNDDNFCNSPADTQKTVRLSPQVKASFITPPRGCVPYSAAFQNTSAGGLNFLWNFGDGTTSTLETPPPHLYSTAGNYRIILTAFDSTSCNKVNSDSLTISVSPVPTASFTYSPNPPEENKFTSFTNQSTGAIAYIWKFGDGDTSTEINPRHIFNATGTYNVCLNARNEAGCSDDICMPVSALIKPLLDVPNAFTPGKFGVNAIVKVRGFGIKNMQWNIYNRWGQLVFESANSEQGWDGTFKGKVQPIDVYTYTLDVIFSDGKKLRKTGDITLLK